MPRRLADGVPNGLFSQGRASGRRQVLSLIAQGQTNRGAAARLFISEATVKTHLLDICVKLNVNDRAAAVATACERELLPTSRST